MALPDRTSAQRSEDLAHATEIRHQRALIKTRMKSGEVSLAEVLQSADDPVIARMKVEVLLASLPGYSDTRAGKLMDELGISHSRRVQGLGSKQRAALLERFETR